jgi:AcrR family transcriptional regulator
MSADLLPPGSPPFTPSHKALAEALSEDPANPCVADLARRSELSRGTVYRLLADKDARRWLNHQVEELFTGALPLVYAAALQKALDGDLRAIKLLLERFDPAWKQQQVLEKGNNVFQFLQALKTKYGAVLLPDMFCIPIGIDYFGRCITCSIPYEDLPDVGPHLDELVTRGFVLPRTFQRPSPFFY